MARRSVRLDHDRLNVLAGVTFTGSDLHELVLAVEDYRDRFRVDVPVPDFMLVDEANRDPRKANMEARRAFVDEVAGIWQERVKGNASTRGSVYRIDEEIHAGPLIDLLQELFRTVEEATPPSAATLHHDLTVLAGSEERKTGKGPRRARRVRHPRS